MKAASVEMAAANIGTHLVYQGLIDGEAIVLHLEGKEIPIRSTRVGMIIFGSGYKEKETSENESIEVPPAYRQSILVHEARHSDCKGGITRAAIQIARAAPDAKTFNNTFPNLDCGQLHVPCPAGHPLAGITACDKQPWGAYTVGAVFSMARARAEPNEVKKAILKMALLDYLDRVLVDPDKMLFKGGFAPPDMSSVDFDFEEMSK